MTWYEQKREQVTRWYEKLQVKWAHRKALTKLIKGHYANTDKYRWSPLYIVTTAWRSCDTQPFPELKTLFTARLRAIYLDQYSGGEQNDEVLTLPTLLNITKKVTVLLQNKGHEPGNLWLESDRVAFEHWLIHSWDALTETQSHPIWGSCAQDVFGAFKGLKEESEQAYLRSRQLFTHMQNVYGAVQRGEYTYTKKEGNP